MAAKYWLAGNPNAEISNAEVTALGELDATELDLLDGVSAGTATASKAAIYGAYKQLPGIRNNVTVQSGTAAEDLTSVDSDTVWIASTVQAAAITLPQATANNAGMVIKIIAGATWSTTAFKLGFASGGSTVMTGMLYVSAINAQDVVESLPITTNAKNLVIDADAVATAGGAIGSVYTFTYISANLVHVDARGTITTGTVAPDATASVTGGI